MPQKFVERFGIAVFVVIVDQPFGLPGAEIMTTPAPAIGMNFFGSGGLSKRRVHRTVALRTVRQNINSPRDWKAEKLRMLAEFTAAHKALLASGAPEQFR
jgi:hypothetical protein